MISTVLALLYGFLLALTFLLTAIAAIVWFFLNSKPKAICGTVLISTASVCAVLGLLSVPLSNYIIARHELPIPENASIAGDAIVTKADAAANAFEKAEAADLIKSEMPQLKPFALFLALPTTSEAQDAVKTFFDKLSSADKRRTPIIERQNIFEQAAGLPLTKESASDASWHRARSRFVALIQRVDKPLPSDNLTEFMEDASVRLPDGFYRYSLLKAIYTSAKLDYKLEALKVEHQNRVRERMHKMLAGIALSYAIIITGVIALILFAISIIRKKESLFVVRSANPVIEEFSFKSVYCFALLLYYVQFCLSFPVGISSAIDPRIAGYIKLQAIPVTTITLAINLILIVLCAKWMIFNPLGVKTISTIKSLFSGNVIKAALLGTGACCAVKAIVTLGYWLAYVLFQHVPTTNNVVSDQISSFAMAPDATKLICLFAAVSIIAPLGEEFAFRGLLYPSIRRKTGVLAGIILSSAIFAAYHMDPGSFLGLFGVGIGLAYLYTRSKSLLPSVFMHATWNSSFLLLAWLLT